jgi:hypothetical protein
MSERLERHMGNENEVKDIIDKSKEIFLPSEFPDVEGKVAIYSLRDEFAKTKKSKTTGFKLVVVAFLAVLILITILITNYVQQQYRKEEITVTEFEDLKLKELFDTAKRNQQELEQAKKELEELRIGLDSELRSATSDRERSSIRARYNNLMRQKNREIASKQREIDSYDLRMRENIRKAEEIVNNHMKLHRLKMEEQRQELITRYNPYFTSSTLQRILRSGPDRSVKDEPEYNEYHPVLSEEKIISKSNLNTLQKKTKNQLLLTERLRKVPYINSVKPALQHIENMSLSSIHQYEELWSTLAKTLNKRNSLLNNYQYAFDHLTKTSPESGYIIDPRNPNNIGVYINKIHSIKEGDTALVFRADDEYIGKISFFFGEEGIRAKVVSLKGMKEIEPFDKILLEKITKE